MKARIELEVGQSPEQGEELLLKALGAQHRGDTHSHAFPDPGIDHVSEQIKRLHREMLSNLMADVAKILQEK